MNIPQMGDQCTITFAWAMSSQLEDVWELQDHSGKAGRIQKGTSPNPFNINVCFWRTRDRNRSPFLYMK